MNSLFDAIEGGGSSMIWEFLLGIVINVGCLVVLVRSFRRPSRRFALACANICLAGVVLLVALAWFGCRNVQASAGSALASAAHEQKLSLLVRGYIPGLWNILLGACLSILPFLSGVALLIRGAMLPTQELSKRPGLAWAGLVLGILGFGLSGWALSTFIQHEEFRWALMMFFW